MLRKEGTIPFKIRKTIMKNKILDYKKQHAHPIFSCHSKWHGIHACRIGASEGNMRPCESNSNLFEICTVYAYIDIKEICNLTYR